MKVKAANVIQGPEPASRDAHHCVAVAFLSNPNTGFVNCSGKGSSQMPPSS